MFCILGGGEPVSATTGVRQVQGFSHARAYTGSNLHPLSHAWDPQPLTSHVDLGWLLHPKCRRRSPCSMASVPSSGCVCANHLYEALGTLQHDRSKAMPYASAAKSGACWRSRGVKDHQLNSPTGSSMAGRSRSWVQAAPCCKLLLHLGLPGIAASFSVATDACPYAATNCCYCYLYFLSEV